MGFSLFILLFFMLVVLAVIVGIILLFTRLTAGNRRVQRTKTHSDSDFGPTMHTSYSDSGSSHFYDSSASSCESRSDDSWSSSDSSSSDSSSSDSGGCGSSD